MCRARGAGRAPPPRIFETYVISLIFIIGAPQIYTFYRSVPSRFLKLQNAHVYYTVQSYITHSTVYN